MVMVKHTPLLRRPLAFRAFYEEPSTKGIWFPGLGPNFNSSSKPVDTAMLYYTLLTL